MLEGQGSSSLEMATEVTLKEKKSAEVGTSLINIDQDFSLLGTTVQTRVD